MVYSENILRGRAKLAFRADSNGARLNGMDTQRYLVAGPLLLDRRDERLFRGKDPVRIGGKALALLGALMERPRTLVTKDELFDRVWPGLAVSESVLTTAVKELRQALDDDARDPKWIQTVYGRGYRFLSDTHASDALPSGPSPSAKRWQLPSVSNRPIILGLVALVLTLGLALTFFLGQSTPEAAEASTAPNAKSIAVLPFEDLSPQHDQQWFAAGLTEEILNSLAGTPDLHVVARTSTMSIAPGDVREIGKRLNVAHILEGSVRRDGNRVRVTAQLIRASDGFHLWSENYDRPADDIVTIQENIAVAIAKALDTVMTPERLKAMVSLGTRSVEAYEEYLKGLAFEQRGLVTGADADVQLASEAYERAREIDPSFAAAHWEAAQAWFGNTTRVGSSVTEKRGNDELRLHEYLKRIDAAIASSRGRPENFKYRSARALIDLRFREALSLMLLYLEERPRDVDTWEELVDLAGYTENRRLMSKAAERIHTLSLETGSPRSRAITASVLAQDIPNAVSRARQQLAKSPGEALIEYQSHRAFLMGGHRDEARAVLAQIRASSLPSENKLLAELRQACADGGSGAKEIAERMTRLPDASLSGEWHKAQLLGDTKRAVEVLRPLDRPDRLATLMQYLVYPSFDARPFPLLQARLKADRISRPPPSKIPFACRA